MRKDLMNMEIIAGRVYDHKLEKKVTGAASKNPGTEYIGGTLDIATDEDCLNVITIYYTYVTKTTKAGKPNSTYTNLEKLIDSGKTVLADGKEVATIVSASPSLRVNDFYSSKNGGEKELVSAKRNEGGFLSIVAKMPKDDYKVRNYFETDILINSVIEVEKEDVEPYAEISGYVFDFRGAILPVTLIARDAGIGWATGLGANKTNPVFTKVWGSINSSTFTRKVEEESAFGDPIVKEYTRSVKEWIVKGASTEIYEIGDEEQGITVAEFNTLKQNRETYLAEVRKRQEDYEATKSSTSAPVAAAPTAASSFNF